MNLAKANPRTIATLIVNGRRQLSEVPLAKRGMVEKEVLTFRRERLREEYDKLTHPKLKQLFVEITGVTKQTKREVMLLKLADVELPLPQDD